MSFIARYPGSCAFCGEQMKGSSCSFAPDNALVHTACLVPYATGVDAVATAIHRNERRCGECFMVHAGDCL